jgi:hypothetical protein
MKPEQPKREKTLPTKEELRAFQLSIQRLQMSRELERAEETTLERLKIREDNARLYERLCRATASVGAPRAQDKKLDMIRAKLEVRRQEFNRMKQERLREEEKRYLEWVHSRKQYKPSAGITSAQVGACPCVANK